MGSSAFLQIEVFFLIDDDDEMFLRNVWQTTDIYAVFPSSRGHCQRFSPSKISGKMSK